MKTRSPLLLGVGLGTLVASQAVSSVCQIATNGLFDSGGLRRCLNADALTNNLKKSTELVPLFNNWLKGMCDEDCPEEVLVRAANRIQQSCAPELAAGNAAAVATLDSVKNFTMLQDTLCLQTISNSSFCITNIFSDLERSFGRTLTAGSLPQSINTNFLPGSTPAAVTCTDCVHAGISISGDTSPATQDAIRVCGAEFGDGRIPSSVRIAPRAPASGAGGLRVGWGVGMVLAMGGVGLLW